MVEDNKICAREGCNQPVVKRAHNQKYCHNDCTRMATNATLVEKYHEKVAIKKGKKRACRTCGNQLSRYNENKICNPCMDSANKSSDESLQELLAAVSW